MKRTIVIGAGPAGVSTALYAARGNVDVTLIYSGYGALEKAHKIENYYGLDATISGRELFERGLKQVKNIGVTLVEAEVLGIVWDEAFKVSTTQGNFDAEALVLATGTSRKKAEILGLEDFEGRGVSYCATCDGFFFRGRDICVIGNSDYAIHEIEALLPLANKTYLLTNGLDLDNPLPEGVELIKKKISYIKGETIVDSVYFEDESKIDVNGVFVAMGSAGTTDLAKKIGVETLNDKILVNENMETNVKGVFACGDCVGGFLQVAKAVYDGSMAGTSVIKYLKSL